MEEVKSAKRALLGYLDGLEVRFRCYEASSNELNKNGTILNCT
jgi:hypothetical protein